jgi:hypothetical protein
MLPKIGKEFLAVCQPIVSGVMNMVHHHLPEGICVVPLEDGKVVLLHGVIEIVIRNLIGTLQVRFEMNLCLC